MLPRSQRSIFHLGEEGGDDNHLLGADGGHGEDDGIMTGVRQRHARGRGRERDADGGGGGGGVGLQIILVQKHQQHSHGRPCHIVLKQMVVWPPARHRRHLRRRPCSFLLRACSLCRRELSPDKDVYMYRGDQGFCSEECRWQQMLTDEAREHEAMVKKERRRGLHHHHHHGPPRPSPAIGGGSPGRLLAVA